MNACQNIADTEYPEGFVRCYVEEPHKNHGDTLAEFIAKELDQAGDDLEEGLRLMATAREELQAVEEGLMAAIITERKQNDDRTNT